MAGVEEHKEPGPAWPPTRLGGVADHVLEHDSTYAKLLRIAPELLHELELPRVVMVGEESSGKSSTLERLVHMPFFPVDRQMCTRMPIELRLRRKTAAELAEFHAVTNMTTAGLLVFNREATDTNSVYFASAVFLLIAIPVGAVFIGELASLAFVSRERAVVKHRLRQSILIRGRPPSPPPGGDDDERPRPPQRRGTTTIDAKYLSFLKESAGRSHQPVDMAGTTVPVVKETP